MNFILQATIIYLLAGILQFFVKNEKKFCFCIVLNLIASILALIPVINTLFFGDGFVFNFNFGKIIGESAFVLDSLSAFFVLIISVISLLSLIYGKKYLFPYKEKTAAHLFLFNIFIISMIYVVLAQNALFFLIAWEIMSLSSFLLMLYDGEKAETRKISIQYLVMMHFGVLFLIAGFTLLNLKTGSLNFSDFKGQINNLIFILFFTGFGIKAGFAPLHTWLPKAHPVAPSHVSALMSGVMIKTGMYGILRILTLNSSPSLFEGYLVLFIGLLSGFFGILYAISRRDFKQLLAYSSVENMGIAAIGAGIGMLGYAYNCEIMASLGFLGCFLHMLNHSIFKPLMFFGAGSVYKQTGTKDLERLGGLIKNMPESGILILIGSLAISAIPPFNGFISEFLIYLGFLNSFESGNYFLIPVMILSMATLAFIGAMALIAFTNAFGIIFLGHKRTEIQTKETPFSMRFPMYVLAIFILFIGFFPACAVNLVKAPVSVFAGFNPQTEILNGISYMNFLLVFCFGALFGLRFYLLKGKTEIKETWGCGYDRESAKIQYSANSYTRPFLGFLTPFYERVLEFKQIKELFPKKTSFKSKIYDIFENYLIRPIVKMDEFIIKRFYWIQSGNTQRYLWYGVLALILSLILVLGDKI